jgi:hypothetical protein
MRKTNNNKNNVNQLCIWAMLLHAILFIDINLTSTEFDTIFQYFSRLRLAGNTKIRQSKTL